MNRTNFTQIRALPLAIVLSLTLAGTAIAGTDVKLNSARQESQIWTTYELSPYLRAHGLEVTVADGEATITGTVEEDVSKALAEEIALGVEGISSVDNQIEVRDDYTPTARGSERGFGDFVDDTNITAAIKAKLLWSRHASGLNTNVDTNQGRVELKGTASSVEAKKLAGTLAINTQGVRSVDNQLVVDSNSAGMAHTAHHDAGTAHSARNADNEEIFADNADAADRADPNLNVMQDVSDTWITTKVKSTFMYSSNVDGSDISVSTQDSEVTLAGMVDSGAEQALAVSMAENVRGVKSVNSEALTYVD